MTTTNTHQGVLAPRVTVRTAIVMINTLHHVVDIHVPHLTLETEGVTGVRSESGGIDKLKYSSSIAGTFYMFVWLFSVSLLTVLFSYLLVDQALALGKERFQTHCNTSGFVLSLSQLATPKLPLLGFHLGN